MAWFVDTSTRRWRWGRIRALLALVMAALAWIYFGDESPPDDADMQIAIPRIPDAENGMAQLAKLDTTALHFDKFAKAHGVNDTDIDGITEGLSRNDTVVDAFLVSATPALNQLDALLALPHFEVPGDLSFKNTQGAMPQETSSALDLSRVLDLRFQRRAQAGDYAGATDDVLRLRHLAQRFSEGHLYMIHLLMFFAIDGIADAGCVDLFNDKRLPTADLARLAQAWSTEIPWAETFRRSMMMEYQFMSNTVQTSKAKDYYHAYAFAVDRLDMLPGIRPTGESVWDKPLLALAYYTMQPNATRRLALAVYRPAEHLLDGTYAARPPLPPVPRFSSSFGAAVWLAMPNFIGREFAVVVGPTWNSVAVYGFAHETEARLVRVGLALRQYYDDHHELPSSLGALVPQYLAAVPTDPFDGQPLRYDPARALVYSVGKSLNDQHGSKYADRPPNKQDPYARELAFDDDEQPTLELKFAQKPAPTALPAK
jgi:hypothetical protein